MPAVSQYSNPIYLEAWIYSNFSIRESLHMQQILIEELCFVMGSIARFQLSAPFVGVGKADVVAVLLKGHI
jgi:hypothetical protein